MIKLATQLQGRTTYDEFQNNTDIRQPEKALILAIFAEAAIDIVYDLKNGNDIKNPCRVIGESGKRCIMPPKKIAIGRPQLYCLSGYAYFFDNSLEDWSFLWGCQVIAEDWQGYAKTLRSKILRLIKQSS